MKRKLQHIHERFPGKMRLINCLVAENPDFLDLCCDYDDSIHALRYWACSDDEEAGARFYEYLTLVHDLEMEILQVLASDSHNN